MVVSITKSVKASLIYLAGIKLVSGSTFLLLQQVPPVIKGITLVFTQRLQETVDCSFSL